MTVAKLVATSAVLLIAATHESTNAMQKRRTIPYSPSTPIAARLLPDDETVVIEKGGTESMHDAASVAMGKGPLNEQLDILARADVIAVAEIVQTRGELVHDGTWINTVASVHLTQVIRAREVIGAQATIAEISVPNGEATINGVNVKAGAFPVLPAKGRALIFLSWSRSCSCWRLSEAYSISRNNALGNIYLSNGILFSFRQALLNQPLTRVTEELKRRVK